MKSKIIGLAALISIAASTALAQEPHQEPINMAPVLSTPLNQGTDSEFATASDINAEIAAIEASFEHDEALYQERVQSIQAQRGSSAHADGSNGRMEQLEASRELRQEAKEKRLSALREKAANIR